ncbi:MAG TPA: UDP-N-acetylmuramoyl-L-alanine--D-glutamate ligase [Acidisphaera sp.]|nr:UDP-N-acetylmuramoyl-L-alanine--D-glutamate ligase [Acidisphaera sp.]
MSEFPAETFAGFRVAVLGLGRNGRPAAAALAAMGAVVVAWDDRPAQRDPIPGVCLHDLSQGAFGFDALVLSPGIPHTFPAPHPVAARARAAGVPILSDVELLYRAVRTNGSHARFVGITGTNGKSTTTALLAHILECAAIPVAAGGNLGTPALALPLLPDAGVYVLEMSSYMLERLATIRFDAAAVLNISPDHLDRHGDMAGYVAAKRAIFDRQGANDIVVLGDDDDTPALIGPLPSRVVRISGRTRLVGAPALPGTHNAQNAAAAAALARALGADEAAIARGIATFPGLPHRQQRIATIGGIDFINDSKATNADAAARALACYDRVTWIAGGIAKAEGIEPLAPLFPRIAHALLIGRDAPILARTLAAHRVPHTIVGTLDRAVAAAPAYGATVLLSPACASFDQFSGFDARGDAFAALVHALARSEAA